MQKISPLRASVAKAFNDFKANRLKKSENAENLQTNPFGITFKGVLLQSDVFESSTAAQKPERWNGGGFGANQGYPQRDHSYEGWPIHQDPGG